MTIVLTNFINTAAREDFPIEMVRFVWANVIITAGSDGPETRRAMPVEIFLPSKTVRALQQATFGIRWQKGAGGEYKKVPDEF
jgi:hypothetical protein